MLKDLFYIFFPNCCATCERTLVRNEIILCTECRIELPRIKMDPLILTRLSERLHGEVPFKHVFAFYKFYKTGITQKLLHQLKYGDQPEIGRLVGGWFGSELFVSGVHTEWDVIVPVPLHKKKIRKRGYNQSSCIAEGMAAQMGIPTAELLTRRVMNETQTNKSRMERWKNVEGIFMVKDKKKVENRRILLIDDVVTTGATLQSCTIELYKSGAAEVSAAVMAMAI